jgi:hypothetical protein
MTTRCGSIPARVVVESAQFADVGDNMADKQDTLLLGFIELAESSFAVDVPITINVNGVLIEGMTTTKKR